LGAAARFGLASFAGVARFAAASSCSNETISMYP
jgi:hypothetical protein